VGQRSHAEQRWVAPAGETQGLDASPDELWVRVEAITASGAVVSTVIAEGAEQLEPLCPYVGVDPREKTMPRPSPAPAHHCPPALVPWSWRAGPVVLALALLGCRKDGPNRCVDGSDIGPGDAVGVTVLEEYDEATTFGFEPREFFPSKDDEFDLYFGQCNPSVDITIEEQLRPREARWRRGRRQGSKPGRESGLRASQQPNDRRRRTARSAHPPRRFLARRTTPVGRRSLPLPPDLREAIPWPDDRPHPERARGALRQQGDA
jgi:hypothetical protein